LGGASSGGWVAGKLMALIQSEPDFRLS